MNGPLSELSSGLTEQQKLKRRAELHALDGCAEDMSDVKFTLAPPKGQAKAVMTIFGVIAGFAAVFFIKRLPSKAVGAGSGKALPIFLFIAVMALIIFMMIFADSKKARLSVEGKIIYYKNKAWKAEDISHIEINNSHEIKIFSNGRLVIRASQADENSEKLIAWAKKCSIPTQDKRTPFEELYGEPLDIEAQKIDTAEQIIKKYR